MLAEFCVILFTLAASTERLARQKHWRRCSSIPSIHRVERVLHDLTKEWSGTSSLPRFPFSSTLSLVRIGAGDASGLLLQNTWGRFLYGVKMVLGQFWGLTLTPHVILVTQDALWRLCGHDGHVVSLTVNTFPVHIAKKPPVSWRSRVPPQLFCRKDPGALPPSCRIVFWKEWNEALSISRRALHSLAVSLLSVRGLGV